MTRATMRVRRLAYELLEDEESAHPWARRVRIGIVALILASVAAGMLDTVPSIHARLGRTLVAIEMACILVFTLEYGLRVWSAVEDRAGRYHQPVRGRLRFMATPLALVDLVAILPFWLSLLLPMDLVALRAIRLFRLLKLARHSPALDTLEVVLMNERRSLGTLVGVLAITVIVLATLMQQAEGEVQPEIFGSVPAAMWWAIITVTTVGYGDVVPVTLAGRLIAASAAIIGIGMFALPTAIIGAGFLHELNKRGFARTAAMVARAPLFSHLGPAELAEVTGLLHPHDLPPRYIVTRRNEHGHGMYFIDEGRVVVRAPGRRYVLERGDFFGELALLDGRPRAATVITLTRCRLLELGAAEFHRLMDKDPVLREVILTEAERHHRQLEAEEDGPAPSLAGEGGRGT